MRLLLGVCGCSDQVDELPRTRSPIRSLRKSRHSHPPSIVQKLEELGHHHRCESKSTNTNSTAAAGGSLHKKYDEVDAGLNKCRDELRELQDKSLTVTPSHLRQKYVTMGDHLKQIKADLLALEGETRSMQPENQSDKTKCQELHNALSKNRKDLEDELQKCWTQLKLSHLESQFASAAYGKGRMM